MKKFFALILALMTCISLASPAFAADSFVPSISYKGSPDIVPIKDANGKYALGLIRDKDGNVLEYIYGECLLVTPVADAKKSTAIPQDAKEMLLYVYEKLTDGSMTLPYEKEGFSDKMVIKDLFDVSWVCDEAHKKAHEEYLKPEGNVLEVIFKVGVKKNTVVSVMTYKEEAWSEIAGVENMGNGNVLCTFEHLCPVAFSVPVASNSAPPRTGDMMGQDLTLWMGLMAFAAVALVGVVAVSRKRK